MSKQKTKSRNFNTIRENIFYKKIKFWLLASTALFFSTFFIVDPIFAHSSKDPMLVAAYEQLFKADKKQTVQTKKKSKHTSQKDPELVAFYELVFGKDKKIIKQKPNNKKSTSSKSKPIKPQATKPIISSQASIEKKPVEIIEEKAKDIPEKSLSISQNIEPEKKEPVSSDETQSEQGPDLAALFAKAFGKKAKALPAQINVELRINKESLGDVVVYSNQKRNKINKVQTETFLVLLEDILKEHVFKRTKDEISKTDKVTFTALKKLGVIATYNSTELSLDLQIDSALRKPRILTIRKRSTKNFIREENKVIANDSSAYMNLFSNLGLSSGSDPDLKLKLESSFNFKGLVLENSTSYINDQWDINDTRLTYDEPDKLKRYVLGDISTGNRNFQENLQLQGLRLSKEFTMDPKLQLRPRGNESFILETDSEVEVYINDILQQRFDLKGGTYSLQDIGLSHGANNIRIRIKDEFGKVTEKSSLQFYDSHLLKPGLSLYAFSVGILSNDEAYISDQLKHEPIVSAYYQRGLSKSVTLSLDAQISPDSYLMGSETIASVPLGSIKHSLGLSGGKDKDTGFATRFELKPNIKRQLIGLDTLREDMLELDTTIGRFVSGWTISGEYRSEDFAMINEVSLPGADNYKLRANLQTQFGVNLGNDWYGSLALSASDYYDAEKDLTARLSATRGFNNGMRLSLGASYGSDSEYAFNMRLSIPLSREKHKRRKDLDFLANTKDNSLNTKLRIQPLSLIGKNSLAGSLEHRQAGSNNQQKLDLTYKDIRYDTRFIALNSNSGAQQLNIGLNSSLLCVGKNCAISRPVSDSFALISGPSNQKMPIAINNGSGSFKYSSDNDSGLPDNYTALIPKKGSHAVLALDSYRYQSVNIDEATLPNGYDTEKTEFEVFPGYHQGFLIKAGGEPAVILDGFLVDKNNKPLPYKGGQWVPLAAEGKTIAFFSNKAGRFRVTSIPAGKYKLELFDYPDMKTIEITVPDKKGEVFDTGNLVISG